MFQYILFYYYHAYLYVFQYHNRCARSVREYIWIQYSTTVCYFFFYFDYCYLRPNICVDVGFRV